MSKTQEFPISAPKDEDKQNLTDFAATVQRNAEDLFLLAHSHETRTTAPASTDGAVGDILPVVIGTSYYLYVKFASVGWKRVVLS